MTSNDTALKDMAENALDCEERARKRLRAALANPADFSTPQLMRDVLATAGAAEPWHRVLELGATTDLTTAVTQVRRKAQETLLSKAETVSTCPVNNEAERHNREGLRTFLRSTESLA